MQKQKRIFSVSLSFILFGFGSTVAFAEPPSQPTAYVFEIHPFASAHKEMPVPHLGEAAEAFLAQKGWSLSPHQDFKTNFLSQVSESQTLTRLNITLKKADNFYAQGNSDEALPFYLEAIEILTQLNTPSLNQIAQLENLRLQTASRLLALQEREDDVSFLVLGALRANPHLELDAKKYPPRLRKRFAKIRSGLTQELRNPLVIRSLPSGAIVFIEGRSVGVTPLHLLDALPAGSYRLWVEKNEVRAPVQWITLTNKGVEKDINFEIQYRFFEKDSSFHLPPEESSLHQFCDTLRQVTQKHPIFLVGALPQNDGNIIFSVFVDAQKTTVIHTASKPQTSPEDLQTIIQTQMNALLEGNGEHLSEYNFFNPHPNNPILKPATSQEKWETWTLLGLSTGLLGATIAATLFLWQTPSEEGQLQIRVLP